MLVVVLVLVLAAAGLLVEALLRSTMLFAWLSVAVSLVAAVLLAVDWWRRRRALAAAEPDGDGDERAELTDDPFAVSPSGRPADDDPDAEPAEEPTDAADVLAVNESDAEVLVVDERPRYHLTGCGWLGDRPTLPLPVREARELGFTPCVRCSPDRRLAASARKATRE